MSPLTLPDEALRGDSRPDHESDDRERLGDGEGDAAATFAQAELLLVEQRARAP